MEPNWGWDLFRNILSFLDSAGYALVSGVYNVFFTVANAQIFSGDILDKFFSRIQLILATIMIFSLAITALNIIINPDAFKDKQKGAGKIVMRVILSLVMLTLVVPIDIPSNNNSPLNEQISNNGILFGFLYQFQNSVMKDNILGKLVLGSNVSSTTDGDLDSMSDIGGTLATTVAKAFITPALKDTSDDPDVDPNGITENDVLCPEVINDYDYGDPNLSYKSLIKYINVSCDSDEGEVYAFDYTPLLGLVCSIIMAIIILGFTIDVAVRAIKLALLRLIAPIPIISYIIPGQEKNGAFNNWVKTLTSTYIDLFLRIIIIYFGAYVILVISDREITIWQNGPGFFTSLFATVFIIIGVLMFMKQAPKFFQDMFGLKGDGKLFSGFGTMLGAAALTGGIAGSIATNYRAARDEAKEDGKRFAMARGVLSGVGGAFGGAFAGGKALMSADKKQASAVFSAMQRRNAVRASGASLPRRAITGASAIFTGQAPGAHEEQLLEAYNNVTKAAKAHQKMLEEEAVNDGTVIGTASKFGNIGISASGRAVALSGNYKDIVNRINQARAEGKNDLVLANGDMFSLDDINENVLEDLRKDQARNYAGSAAAQANVKVQGTAEELKYAADAAQMKIDVNNYDSVKSDGIGESMNKARKISTSTKSARYRAAARHVGAPPPGGGKGPRGPH